MNLTSYYKNFNKSTFEIIEMVQLKMLFLVKF